MRAVFVQVCKQDVGVRFEAVEHAVAVVRIDVHVRHALHPMTAAQLFDRDTTIVEHTEPRRSTARSVMQPGDGNEAPVAPCPS